MRVLESLAISRIAEFDSIGIAECSPEAEFLWLHLSRKLLEVIIDMESSGIGESVDRVRSKMSELSEKIDELQKKIETNREEMKKHFDSLGPGTYQKEANPLKMERVAVATEFSTLRNGYERVFGDYQGEYLKLAVAAGLTEEEVGGMVETAGGVPDYQLILDKYVEKNGNSEEVLQRGQSYLEELTAISQKYAGEFNSLLS